MGRKEAVEGGTGQLSCSCPAQKSKNFVSRARTTPLRSVVLFPPKTKRTEPLPCREDRVACGRCRSAACPVVGGSAEGPNAQGGCDRSRVKTREKEKQYSFLTDTCHSRLGVPRSSCSKSTADRQPSPPGCPQSDSPSAPPALRRRLVDVLPPPVARDARPDDRPPRWEEGGTPLPRFRGASQP